MNRYRAIVRITETQRATIMVTADYDSEVRSLVEHMYGSGSLVSFFSCLLYTSPSPRDRQKSRMPSSA